MKLGGYAHTNGITFFCDVFKIKTLKKNKEIKQNIEWIERKKWLRRLEKTPLIGGLAFVYYQWKIFDKKTRVLLSVLIPLLFLEEYFYIPLFSELLDYTLREAWIWGLVGIGMLLNIKKIIKLLRYHGAEHKVINCFIKNGMINEKLVKEASRFNKRCGTNLAMITLTLWGIAYLIVPQSTLIQLSTLPIALLLFKKMAHQDTKLDFIYNSLQWITVWEPGDEEVNVAILGFRKLHEGYLIYQREVMEGERHLRA